MSRLSQLISSMENFELTLEIPEVKVVSPEDEEEADFEIEVAEIENEEAEEENNTDKSTIVELRDEVTSIESYIEILNYGLEAKEFSTQLAAAVASKLAPYIDEHVITVASLESYNKDNLEDYYTASLEAASTILQKLKDKIKSFQTRIDRRLKVIGNDKKIAVASNTKADALIKRLSGVKSDTAEVRGAGLFRYIAMGNSVPDNLAIAAKHDLKHRRYLNSNLIKDVTTYTNKIYDILTMSDRAFIPDEESDKILALNNPVHSIPKELLKPGALFSSYIKVHEPNSKSDVKVTQAINSINIQFDIENNLLKNGPETYKITKANVKGILMAVKEYAAFVNSINDSDYDMLDLPKDFNFEKGMKPVVEASIEELRCLVYCVAIDSLISIRHIMVSLLQLAERAINEMEKEKSQ